MALTPTVTPKDHSLTAARFNEFYILEVFHLFKPVGFMIKYKRRSKHLSGLAV
jgi:hypothetical protein